MKFICCFLVFLTCCSTLTAQTTDLSITVEAQDLSGNAISQAHFYQQYQFLVTISNTGAPVSNADFTFDLSSVDQIENVVTQNASGGASSAVNVIIGTTAITGDLPNMPNSSSLELLITVRASPTFLGGATITTGVNAPAGTVDVNPATNTSVISIIITERPIDFQISQRQITPVANAGLASWGDSVTYEMIILNNSAIDYPLQNFSMDVRNVNRAGSTLFTLQNLSCVGSNGMTCPTISIPSPSPTENITVQETYYNHQQSVVFPAGASFTMSVTYRLEEGDCSTIRPSQPLRVGSVLNIESFVNNTGFAVVDRIETETLTIEACPCSDLTAQLDRMNPTGTSLTSWADVVTYDLTITNDGPSDMRADASLINTSTLNTTMEVLSVTCISTTGALDCADLTFAITPEVRWLANEFLFPANSSALIRTTVRFIPPDCSPNGIAPMARVRGAVFERDLVQADCDRSNDFQDDSIQGVPLPACVNDPTSPIIELTEVQTTPAPGAGPYPYGNITYEIVMSNVDTLAHQVRFTDKQLSAGTGILQSIRCTGTTGGAACPTNFNATIGIANSTGDTFWEIKLEDDFILPANSSITYEKVIDWTPECTDQVTDVADDLLLNAYDDALESIASLAASVATPMVPCVDIVVQTYPSVTSAPINSSVEWIVDITNSNISVDASNITFTDLLHPDFTLSGTPTCTLITGNASCISTFNITNNQVEGLIPFMESGSTIQVRIPVTSPSYGGSFENRAEAQPDFTEQGETTPDSNISSSSLFILTTQTTKSFLPAAISTGGLSILSLTLTNSDGFPAQSNISFLDNLSPGITLAGEVFWLNQNGASGTFVGTIGDSTVGIQNLSFPDGTEEVSFGVQVTSNVADFYVNDFQNFSDLNNIDVSTAFASLEVLPVLDLAIEKTVDNPDPQVNDRVTFTITVNNLGGAIATDVEVVENLPSGYNYQSHNASLGTFDPLSGLWALGDLLAGDTATLEITATLNIPGDFLNVVTVSSGNVLTDVNLLNNTAQVQVLPDCLLVPEGFSPNEDYKNQSFFIRCIELYPENQLKIFNRYGSIVYEASNYQNDWEGIPNAGLLHNSGERLPTGTYFWQLDLGDGSQSRVGWVYINY
jgi:gliding motility-associated-like protein/uncharacterized repeat protein (TIGR01451 family)